MKLKYECQSDKCHVTHVRKKSRPAPSFTNQAVTVVSSPQRCSWSCPSDHSRRFPWQRCTRTTLRSHQPCRAEGRPLVSLRTSGLHTDNSVSDVRRFKRNHWMCQMWRLLATVDSHPGMTEPTSCSVSTDSFSSESTRITP